MIPTTIGVLPLTKKGPGFEGWLAQGMLCMVAKPGRVARIFRGLSCDLALDRMSFIAADSSSVDVGLIIMSEAQVVQPCDQQTAHKYSNQGGSNSGWQVHLGHKTALLVWKCLL